MKALLHRIQQAGSAAGRRAGGRYLLEGTRLVERAQRAGVVVEVCASESFGESSRETALLDAFGEDEEEVEVTRVPDEVFAEVSSGRETGAVLALAEIPAVSLPDEGVVLVAVDVTDPGNAGALVRTALAAGADALVAVGHTDPFHPKAVRTSMGSVCKLPVLRVGSISELDGWTLVGTVCEGGSELAGADFSGERVALLMGSEAFGLAPEVLDVLDRRVRIPMRSGVDSFSVNAAAAVVLVECLRSRG